MGILLGDCDGDGKSRVSGWIDCRLALWWGDISGEGDGGRGIEGACEILSN